MNNTSLNHTFLGLGLKHLEGTPDHTLTPQPNRKHFIDYASEKQMVITNTFKSPNWKKEPHTLKSGQNDAAPSPGIICTTRSLPRPTVMVTISMSHQDISLPKIELNPLSHDRTHPSTTLCSKCIQHTRSKCAVQTAA